MPGLWRKITKPATQIEVKWGEQVGQHGVVGEVVDPHDLDVETLALLEGAHGAEEVAAYSTESIDTDLDGHTVSSYCGDGRAGW